MQIKAAETAVFLQANQNYNKKKHQSREVRTNKTKQNITEELHTNTNSPTKRNTRHGKCVQINTRSSQNRTSQKQ